MSGFGDFGIDRIVTLTRCRCDDLNVDAHPVEVEETTIDRGHDLANVAVLERVDLLGSRIRKMRERDPAQIDMRLRQSGSLRNNNVGVNVDRGGGRAPGEAVGIVESGGGAAVAVLAVEHCIVSAVEGK